MFVKLKARQGAEVRTIRVNEDKILFILPAEEHSEDKCYLMFSNGFRIAVTELPSERKEWGEQS